MVIPQPNFQVDMREESAEYMCQSTTKYTPQAFPRPNVTFRKKCNFDSTEFLKYEQNNTEYCRYNMVHKHTKY